jgi:hypothetical protein
MTPQSLVWEEEIKCLFFMTDSAGIRSRNHRVDGKSSVVGQELIPDPERRWEIPASVKMEDQE